MEVASESTADEVTRLRRCIGDLVGVLALPVIWTGLEAPRVATTLLEVLLRMLDLDFAYVSVNDSVAGSPMEWLRQPDGLVPPDRAREIGEALRRHLSDSVSTAIRLVSNPVGDGIVSMAAFRLGIQDAVGVLAAGSRRTGFPTDTERLILQVAANQAAIGLQEARQASQQRHAERMREVNLALREEVDKASMFEEIVGVSAPLRTVLSYVAKVASTESTVLITGETGTGKELVARAIHKGSRRASRGFVSVNCAAIPPPLIASELFGHERGAFTGATQRRIGRFEIAEGGTIFLDEVGELPAETQLALLRVLQEREFERVGGADPVRADVRVLAATNRDLEAAIRAGEFREDLYYRLNVFPIEMPSLRDRREDIPLLVQYFVDRYSRNAGKPIKRVSKKSVEVLQSYSWPGNIRELQNVIERSIILSDAETLTFDERWFSSQTARTNRAEEPLADRVGAQEKALIESALAETQGRVSGSSGAAAKLRLPSSTLESKIKSLGIDKHRFRRTYPR